MSRENLETTGDESGPPVTLVSRTAVFVSSRNASPRRVGWRDKNGCEGDYSLLSLLTPDAYYVVLHSQKG